MAVTAATRALLHERAGGCCEGCGVAGATNAHHRMNRSQGGADKLSNLLLLCGSGTMGCHGTVTMNPHWARVRGLTVTFGQLGELSRSHGGAPYHLADVAVLRWSRESAALEWVLLDDDGCMTHTMLDVVL